MTLGNEIWVSAYKALVEVKEVYAVIADTGPGDAESAILRRLAAGTLAARSSHFDYRICELFKPDRLVEREEGQDRIPRHFWQEYLKADAKTEVDWIAGDFSFEWLWSDNITDTRGKVHGVLLNKLALPGVISSPSVSAEDAVQPVRGRRPATWWPHFAEELACYIHKEGFPDGEGTDGQSKVIDAVFKRMNERGRGEPSRTQVQSVVNAVLSRCRAGN